MNCLMTTWQENEELPSRQSHEPSLVATTQISGLCVVPNFFKQSAFCGFDTLCGRRAA